METVGIITFHESNSLGANLQAYALQQTVSNLGFNAEIINYDRKGDELALQSISYNPKEIAIRIVNKAYGILNRRNRLVVSEKVFIFRNEYLHIGKERYADYNQLKLDPPQYDYYITGSDQVWNPYTGPKDAYYLGFVVDSEKKIAYAPSIGVKRIDSKYHEMLKNYLKDYKAISCRENAGAKVLEEILGRKVNVVLDPTLLLRPDDWAYIENPSIQFPEKYMLCYFLGSLKSSRKTAERIAADRKLKIVDIPGSPVDYLWNVEKAKGIGPCEFLTLVRNASYICTDSFHGTAFSINYEKPFLCFQRRGYNNPMSFGSRLENILTITGLVDCLVEEGKESYNADYSALHMNEATTKLNIQRDLSKLYLTEALNIVG